MQRFLVFLCLFILKVSLSHAAVTINVVESGADVIATVNGSINTADLPSPVATLWDSGVVGRDNTSNVSYIHVGAVNHPDTYLIPHVDHTFTTGGNSSYTNSFFSGTDAVGVWSGFSTDHIYIHRGYSSGSDINASSTWSGATIVSLGLIPGTYVFNWGSGDNSDSLTLNIGGVVTPANYTVSGDVSGLTAGSDGVTLRNNGDNTTDILKVSNGGFTFPEQIDGSSYSVTVPRQPTGQTCNVTNGRGTITGADVTNVAVVCVTNPTVGGTVTGLTAGSDGVTLRNNGDNTTDILKVTNGGFTFPPQYYRSNYSVTVPAQPTGQTCTVSNGVGTNITADVTNVRVDCAGNPVVPPTSVKPIPTLSEWALILLSMLLGVVVFARAGRQQA